ncbi:hypothetical protein Tco_0441017, partial [Tanacetum coccineum]
KIVLKRKNKVAAKKQGKTQIQVNVGGAQSHTQVHATFGEAQTRAFVSVGQTVGGVQACFVSGDPT